MPISGDKMALEGCQVLLAEPGAAAGMVLGGEVPSRHAVALFSCKSVLEPPEAQILRKYPAQHLLDSASQNRSVGTVLGGAWVVLP